jgi:hypothetical protein
MVEDASGYPPGGSASVRADEFRRQARIVDDLFERLGAVVRTLPRTGDLEGWRGPAAELFAASVHEQEVLLVREALRLDSIRTQLRAAAALAEAVPGVSFR